MRLEQKFLRSKVARRMLTFFVLSAFIPVLFLAFLSYWESNQLLVKQAHTRLDAVSAIYKSSIYDRLLLLDQTLKEVSQPFTEGKLPTTLETRLSRKFHNLVLQFPTNDTIKLFGKETEKLPLKADALEHLFNGNSLLLTQNNGSETKIFILHAPNPLAPKNGILIAEVISDFLWGDSDTFLLDFNLCVYNGDYIKIFCTNPNIYPQDIKEHTHAIKGDFTWYNNDEKYIANYSEIFLEPKFLTPRWLVVATQPETDALDSLKKFNTIFWSSVILSVLLILLFSMMQIRRVLVPLERLIEGTRRLGSHDFTTKVDVISSDEFGELASSFNTMSEELGDQFETLAALSKIDQEILSTLNIERIAADVLIHLQKIVSAHSVSISVINDHSSQEIQIYKIDENGKQQLSQIHLLLDSTRQLLIHNPKGIWIDNELIYQQAETKETTAIRHFFLLPLNWKDQMVGFVSLGFPVTAQWKSNEIKRIQDYADRIAVALFTKNREELLIRQARIDFLTGLPNRFLFVEQLQKEIAQNQRTEKKLAVLYIDLDHFKKINDSLGHSVGDKLLCDAGKRLQQCVRKSDTVARLGGDEFAIIINQIESEHQVTSVASYVINALAKPFVIDREDNTVTASIGIAIYPYDGENITDLMRNSDIAMYRAKAKSGNQYIFFEESMNAEVIKRATIEKELRRAISEQQFVLHYQPQVDPETNLTRGVEALVRWNHPENGLVSPGYFISIAEDAGLIAEIGQIVLADACAQFRAWLNQGVVLEYVAVNVSVKQFCQPNFLQTVEAVLHNNNMQAHCLELEITESVLMDDTEVVLGVLHQLQQLGVLLSIDDFGTGYSSMSYLEQLPFDTLKIDMSFVRKIQHNGEGGTIAATIIAMAHALNKNVVAEGVETQAQLDFLRKHNCELIQGYFYSRPLPADELATYVNTIISLEKSSALVN
ncbi:EAL domain-containing protein [Candidatus Nitrotoga sp. M5]|uniref:EAL domain-containing protein n=1 Tax=Candidatus Nitrotoga sp. M5 TaxID=2890409 RepID=UPI001EF5081C|nr:EAL domain-containing protein [Candidatus Nitrotoga sp. M5]CAH1387076.1 Diguanylate cyclase (GGDEF) domain-containing protein [Candidatus Nitrotoga sp. M5]